MIEQGFESMSAKILIANRGEIALRVVRAARELGMASVAVYSEADKDSLHVRHADEAYLIGPPPVRESYLVIENILNAARQAGADVEIGRDAAAAAEGADVLYTDVWVSMGQEDEAAGRRQVFAPYRVDEALFARAAPDAIFLHYLPAHRGDEVTDAVLDHARSAVLDQAENRLHTEKALLLHLLGGEAPAPQAG